MKKGRVSKREKEIEQKEGKRKEKEIGKGRVSKRVGEQEKERKKI